MGGAETARNLGVRWEGREVERGEERSKRGVGSHLPGIFVAKLAIEVDLRADLSEQTDASVLFAPGAAAALKWLQFSTTYRTSRLRLLESPGIASPN